MGRRPHTFTYAAHAPPGDFGRASGMLHTEEVTGSNPVSPTTKCPSQGLLSK